MVLGEFSQMLQSWQFWHDIVPPVFCTGILGCFLLWTAAYLVPLRHTARSVERIAELPFWADEGIDVNVRRARAAEHVQQCRDENLDKAFGRFKSQWLRHKALVGSKETSTVDIGDVVTLEALMPKRFAAWFAPSIPGFFTGAGLLGTVLGLVLGLQGVEFTESPAGGFIATVQPLLSGMYTAFVASIAGIACSLLWNALDGSLRGHLTQSLERLHQACRAVYPSRSVSDLVLAAVESTAAIQVALARQRQENSVPQEEALRRLAAEFHRALADGAACQFAELATAVEASARAQAQLAANLEMLQARLAAAAQATTAMQEAARSSASKLEALGAGTAAVEADAREAVRRLDAGIRDFAQQIAKAPALIHKETLAIFEKEMAKVTRSLHETLEQTREAMEHLSDVLKKAAGR